MSKNSTVFLDKPRQFFYENFFKKPSWRRWGIVAAAVLMFSSVFYLFVWRPPANFPEKSVVTIKPGSSLSAISNQLEREHIIRSPFWFRNLVIFFNGEKAIMAGNYFLKERRTVFGVAQRLIKGVDFLPIKVVIPEGSSSEEIVKIFREKFQNFDEKKFLKLVSGKEGYLFPDTYIFTADLTADVLAEILLATFDKKIKTVQESIESFGRPLEEVIILASLLEEEARTMETRQIIAGILWKRLSLDMPLQVDATFQKVNGKNTFELTLDDLKIDSPYNTYLYKGLPVTAISNPGLDAILAAVTPRESKYLYYLSDKDGNMHYAVTHDGHLRNKQRYLR